MLVSSKNMCFTAHLLPCMTVSPQQYHTQAHMLRWQTVHLCCLGRMPFSCCFQSNKILLITLLFCFALEPHQRTAHVKSHLRIQAKVIDLFRI